MVDATTPTPDPAPDAAPAAGTAPKVGRNDDCPCGSGKKFKKCCINEPAYASPAVTVAAAPGKGASQHAADGHYPAATNATFRGANAPPTMRGGTTSRRRV